MNDYLDPTGTQLTPSYHGKDCLGNGEHPGIECCCDECGYFLVCFPDYNDPNHQYTHGDRRDFWRPIVRDESCLDCKHRDKDTENYARVLCNKTKRRGRDLRARRCLYFEKE